MQKSDSDIYGKERNQCSTKSSYKDTILIFLLNSLKQIAGPNPQKISFKKNGTSQLNAIIEGMMKMSAIMDVYLESRSVVLVQDIT